MAAPAAAQSHTELQWTRLREPRGVRRVFAHPLDSHLAWCATPKGLLATADDGNTFQPVEAAGVQAVGGVTCLAVSPREPGVLVIGSDARGLLLSTDGGRTFKPLGGGEETCASGHIEWVGFCPSDPTGRTLMATHGPAAAGMSISRDLGATWEVLGRDRFLGRFVKQAETIVAAGSMIADEGKVWGIHRSGTDGQRWEETLRNVRPSVPAVTDARWQFYFATLGGAILQSSTDGKSWSDLARSEGSAWASLFYTNGPTERGGVLAAYDPHRQGLCLSRRLFADGLGERQNRGLYVGPYVKSGAECAANANGTTYYVAMNNTLWVGRWTAPAKGPAVVQTRCLPPLVRIDEAAMGRARDQLHSHIAALAADGEPDQHLPNVAAAARDADQRKADMGFTLRARVAHPAGRGAIKSVTADLTGLGGGVWPLLDDGQHDDGQAGDGLYAAAFRFSPDVLQRSDFRERLLLTVKAVDTSGASDTWPAVVGIPRGPMPVGLMRGGWDSRRTEGPVTVDQVRDPAGPRDSHALRFAAGGPGPWKAAWIMPGDGVNSAGLRWLTFRVRAGENRDVSVHLVDFHHIGNEGFFDEPHFSRPQALIADGYLQALTGAYQKVRIPLDRLLTRGLYFLRWHTAGVGLSAEKDAPPTTYWLDDVHLEP